MNFNRLVESKLVRGGLVLAALGGAACSHSKAKDAEVKASNLQSATCDSQLIFDSASESPIIRFKFDKTAPARLAGLIVNLSPNGTGFFEPAKGRSVNKLAIDSFTYEDGMNKGFVIGEPDVSNDPIVATEIDLTNSTYLKMTLSCNPDMLSPQPTGLVNDQQPYGPTQQKG